MTPAPVALAAAVRVLRLLFLGLLGLALTASAAQPAKRNFDLPADQAATALNRLAAQSGVEVLFVTEMTTGLRTQPVRGEFTPLEAAQRMLARTGLTAVQNSRTGALTIQRATNGEHAKNDSSRLPTDAVRNEEPAPGSARGTGTLVGRVTDVATGAHLAGAIVAVEGTELAATVAHDGTFVLQGVPAGNVAVAVSYVGYAPGTFRTQVSPRETARLDATLSPEVVRMQEFRVEGVREGQARAINLQRAATNIRHLVAADAIGNFPDVNAAEALKRMPGISTVRQRGEDRDITIRGAAPDLNAITIDGVSVLSNQVNGRTVSMDVYPAEQLAGVEITKSATPDMDADSIGGAINLRSKSAFDSRERVVTANAYWQYNDLADQSSYRGGLTFSDLFGPAKEWGLQLTLSRAQRKALEETSEPAGWALRSGTAAGTPYAGYSPNNIPFTFVDIERERTGGSLAIERKLGDTGLLHLRGSHNQFIERNGRPRFVLQNVGNIDATRPVTAADDRLTSFSSTALRGQRVVNPRQFTDTGSSLALGGRVQLDEWRLELVGAYARGTNRQDAATGQWQTGTNTAGTINLTDSNRPTFTRLSGPDLNDPAAYNFNQLQVQDRRLNNREYSLKGDATRPVALAGHPVKFSSGFKLRWSPKRWDQENAQYNTLTSGTLTLADPRLGGAYEVSRDFLGGLMTFGPTVAPFTFREFVQSNLSLFVPNAGNTLQNTLAADYYVAEGIYAGYAMGEINVGRLTALAGVRYEHTEIESKAYRQDTAFATSNPARYRWVRNDTQFDNVLPGIHLRYAPTKPLVLRASWNNTLARPAANRISPAINITSPAQATESDRVIVSGGNPNLRATESANLDLAAEYYLQSIGLLSAGYFRKDLDGPIYRRTFDGTYEGQPARLTVFDNAGKARVSGWEFSYQQQLSFLPAPFDGLGVYANFTLVDSEVTLTEPGREGERLPLFHQSDQLGNLALTYQKYGFFVRLSHNWRGDYLQALGNPGLDQYARGFESHDVLASYRLNRRWTVRFEANNLTAEPEEQYVGTSRRNLYFGDTGRAFALGLNYRY